MYQKKDKAEKTGAVPLKKQEHFLDRPLSPASNTHV